MPQCDQCGNDYANLMTIEKNGQRYGFDCFECAIEKMAPRCAVCSTRVIGHGMETDDAIYCCDHCARRAGADARA
ncbi:hypothetical protein [Roseivivax isoporae]|uniref:Prokaryotic metallothionein n=1 Tax=Roseivivax isoporae LMG 25204 TaxID=1449351 RepID=X7FAC5_9RHOB|nr:hypothetical protein [Roseivivax isoporae]ETX29031.1 hypothetical protein RISW2_03560 [Roseivivax isoporae LMG 25204]